MYLKKTFNYCQMITYTVELGYNVIKGTEYIVSL
jgi:hypothetical protein